MNPVPGTQPPPIARIRPALAAVWGGTVVFLAGTLRWREAAGKWWHGEKVKLEGLVHSCWWWAGLMVAGLVLVLFLTSRWWARAWPAAMPGEVARAPRWLIPAVLLVMAAGAAVRVPRLGLSLYNDEAHAFRAQLVGEIPHARLGKPEYFRPVSWWSTLYENRVGNNSLPFSLISRAGYDTWRRLTGAPAGQVNETALRVPVLICGVLGIGALAWLGWRLGGPVPALLVAGLAALHPWHVRYSVEARCYGPLLLVVPLLFVALDASLRSGRWKHWLLFGALMGITVAVWLGSAHFLVGLYLTLGALTCFPGLRDRRAAVLMPAVVAGVFAVGLYLLINLPLYLQLSKVLQDPGFFKSPHPFPWVWFQDVAGFLGFGIPGLPVDPAHSAQPSVVQSLGTAWAVAFAGAIVVWLAGLTAGSLRLFRQGGTGAALVGTLGGGAFLTWAYCTAKGILFLKWYALFLLPGLLMILAVGVHRFAKPRGPIGYAILLLPLAVAWFPGLSYYTNHGRENLRGAVELARGTAYPASLSNPRRTLYAITWSESPVYDPAATTLENAAGLQDLILRARKESRPLFVAYGYEPQALADAGDVLAMLHDAALFRLAAVLPGLDDPSYTHYLYQLIAEPAVPLPP